MAIGRPFSAALVSICISAVVSVPAWGHGGTGRVAEGSTAEARLFVADAATGDVVAVDLPSGDVVSRLSTPPFIMSLALSADQRHLFAMRGRNTDRDWVTVVATGLLAASGELMPPVVARTIPASSPGPGNKNRTVTVGGKDALMMEGTAEFIVLDDAAFTGFSPVRFRTYKLAAPDHYFYLEEGPHLYIGHLRKGYIQVLNRETTEEVTRIEGCPLTHGKAKDDATGRLFYACMRDIMVIGTRGEETNQVVARIPYPENQRVGAFYHGPGQVLWAYTEGTLEIIYRLDAGREPYELEVLPLAPSLRQFSTEGGAQLLSLTRGGILEIRDGGTGEVVHAVKVSAPFEDDYHEHTDKAILPDIKSLHGDAFVTLPHEGRVAVVDVDSGTVERYIEIGGTPTRAVLVDASGAAASAAAN